MPSRFSNVALDQTRDHEIAQPQVLVAVVARLDGDRGAPGSDRTSTAAQLTMRQVPSGCRQAVPWLGCGRPSIIIWV